MNCNDQISCKSRNYFRLEGHIGAVAWYYFVGIGRLEEEEEFIYHKYTYTSNFRLIHVSDGLPEKQ